MLKATVLILALALPLLSCSYITADKGQQFNYADYASIQEGATLDEVERILGGAGAELSRTGDTVMYQYANDPASDGIVIVTMQGGGMTLKSQAGLTP